MVLPADRGPDVAVADDGGPPRSLDLLRWNRLPPGSARRRTSSPWPSVAVCSCCSSTSLSASSSSTSCGRPWLGDIAVIGALGLALVAPPRTVPWAAVAGSAASVAISLAVHYDDAVRTQPDHGVLARGRARSSSPGSACSRRGASGRRRGRRALASVIAFSAVLAALIEWRNKGGPLRHHVSAVRCRAGLPLSPPAGTCGCSTPVSSSRLSRSATRNGSPSLASCTTSSPIT